MDHKHPINTGEHAANDTGSVNWEAINADRKKLTFKRPPARRKQK